MSASFSCSLIVGVPVTRGDFFVKEGEKWVCRNGHSRKNEKSKFCEEDGLKFERRDVEIATRMFAEWAEESKSDPDGLWDNLRNCCGYNKLGIFNVASMAGSESDACDLALGFFVCKVSDYKGNQKPEGFSIEHLEAKAKEVEAVAKDLGISRKAQVFLCGYVSY